MCRAKEFYADVYVYLYNEYRGILGVQEILEIFKKNDLTLLEDSGNFSDTDFSADGAFVISLSYGTSGRYEIYS